MVPPAAATHQDASPSLLPAADDRHLHEQGLAHRRTPNQDLAETRPHYSTGALGEGGDDVLAQQLNGLEVLLVAHAIDPEDELVVAQLLKLPAPLDEEVGIAD